MSWCGHAGIIPAPAAFVPRFDAAFRRSRGAMQRYSWTNNRQPVFSARLAGPLSQRGFD
jgi:hypothetical protein